MTFFLQKTILYVLKINTNFNWKLFIEVSIFITSTEMNWTNVFWCFENVRIAVVSITFALIELWLKAFVKSLTLNQIGLIVPLSLKGIYSANPSSGKEFQSTRPIPCKWKIIELYENVAKFSISIAISNYNRQHH